MIRRLRRRSAFAWLGIVLVGCAGSSGQLGYRDAAPKSAEALAAFEPKPDGRAVTIRYAYIDSVLGAIVLETGPSLRKSLSRPSPMTGTRIVARDASAFRAEGNKVLFTNFDASHRKAIAACVEILVTIGRKVDLPRLPRDEQLAYWLNLHNMLVISELTKRYPVMKPQELRVGENQLPLHEAPLVTLKGVDLSLNDIRKGIVFRYWEDPRVIYGFFTGELASPKIRPKAWAAASLSKDLDKNAREFVNALRGVREGRGRALIVSPLYSSAKDQFFPDWPTDFRAHLRAFSGPTVRSAVDRTDRVVFGRYEARTADLIGGYALQPKAPLLATRPLPYANQAIVFSPADDPAINVALSELAEKRRQLKLREIEGVVTIEDEPFDAKDQRPIP